MWAWSHGVWATCWGTHEVLGSWAKQTSDMVHTCLEGPTGSVGCLAITIGWAFWSSLVLGVNSGRKTWWTCRLSMIRPSFPCHGMKWPSCSAWCCQHMLLPPKYHSPFSQCGGEAPNSANRTKASFLVLFFYHIRIGYLWCVLLDTSLHQSSVSLSCS